MLYKCVDATNWEEVIHMLDESGSKDLNVLEQ